MKRIRLILPILLVSIFFMQCSKDPRAKIQALEKQMSEDNFTLDENGIRTANELVSAYLDFADKHKESAEAPDYIYKAADLSLNLNNSKQSLDLYNRIIYQYPDFRKVPECLFLIGYIYENYFQELGKAREIYQSFLSKYPDHDFADDARISIENLGKSPEELIRSFEEKNRVNQEPVNL
jgi:tetratricopeptide (TPR) repeat protein